MNISIGGKKIDAQTAARMAASVSQNWPRDTELRKTGMSAGKADIYYYSPSMGSSGGGTSTSHKLVDSQLRHISETVDLTTSAPLDYQAASSVSKLMQNNPNISLQPARKPPPPPPVEASASPSQLSTTNKQQFDFSRGVRADASLVPPIRQTASIFKQPVTVHRGIQDSKVKHDLKHGTQDKPKQLFWEKRLEGLRACASDGEEFAPIDLGLKPVGPFIDEVTVLQSVATSLHVSNGPITGQTAQKSYLTQNPGAFLNPEQPLIYAATITEDEIRRQEEKVNLARRRLQDVLRT